MSSPNQLKLDKENQDTVWHKSSQPTAAFHTQSNSASPLSRPSPLGQSSFTLTTLFQIVTGCSVFFAVLQASPLIAILGTIILTPAFVRTAIASEVYLQKGVQFTWLRRSRYFLESTGLTVVSLFFSAAAFALISIFFGIFSAAVASVMGLSELARDIAFIGTVCGMIWGGTAGFIVFGLCIRNWYTAAAIESDEERLSCSETAN